MLKYIQPCEFSYGSPQVNSYIIDPAEAANVLRAAPDDLPAAQDAVVAAEEEIESRIGRKIRITYGEQYFNIEQTATNKRPDRLILTGGPFSLTKVSFVKKDDVSSVLEEWANGDGAGQIEFVRYIHGNELYPTSTSFRLPKTGDTNEEDFWERWYGGDEAILIAHVSAGYLDAPKSIVVATKLLASALYDKGHARTEIQIENLLSLYVHTLVAVV